MFPSYNSLFLGPASSYSKFESRFNDGFWSDWQQQSHETCRTLFSISPSSTEDYSGATNRAKAEFRATQITLYVIGLLGFLAIAGGIACHTANGFVYDLKRPLDLLRLVGGISLSLTGVVVTSFCAILNERLVISRQEAIERCLRKIKDEQIEIIKKINQKNSLDRCLKQKGQYWLCKKENYKGLNNNLLFKSLGALRVDKIVHAGRGFYRNPYEIIFYVEVSDLDSSQEVIAEGRNLEEERGAFNRFLNSLEVQNNLNPNNRPFEVKLYNSKEILRSSDLSNSVEIPSYVYARNLLTQLTSLCPKDQRLFLPIEYENQNIALFNLFVTSQNGSVIWQESLDQSNYLDKITRKEVLGEVNVLTLLADPQNKGECERLIGAYGETSKPIDREYQKSVFDKSSLALDDQDGIVDEDEDQEIVDEEDEEFHLMPGNDDDIKNFQGILRSDLCQLLAQHYQRMNRLKECLLQEGDYWLVKAQEHALDSHILFKYTEDKIQISYPSDEEIRGLEDSKFRNVRKEKFELENNQENLLEDIA
ncbi:MAG: hypothetical protein R3E91_02940 [Chlamydiales bacterium]